MENSNNQCLNKLRQALKKAIEKELGKPYASLSIKEKDKFLKTNLQNRLDELKLEGGEKGKLIEKESLVAYSANTLERFLGKNPRNYTTSLTTLHTSALYLGYESYDDFTKKNPIDFEEEENSNSKEELEAVSKSSSSFNWLIGAVLAIVGFFSFKNMNALFTNPLLLIGFVLLLFFGIHRLVVHSGLIQPLTQNDSRKAMYLILQYGFYIALVTVILGIALQAYRLKHSNQRTDTAKRLVIKEILNNAHTLDARLTEVQFALGSLVDDDFNDTFKNKNKNLFPRDADALNKSYDQLILNERLNAIQHTLVDRPLKKEFGVSMVDNVINSQPHPDTWLLSYLDQLNHIEWATQNLLKAVTADIKINSLDTQLNQLATYYQSLYQHSIVGHLYGLKVIHEFNTEATQAISEELKTLKKLQPRVLKNNNELDLLLMTALEKLTEAIAAKKDILSTKEQQRDDGLDSLTDIVLMLNSWDENDDMSAVAGKAISLKYFGRSEDAVKKFDEFRKRFAKNDKGLNQYVNTAQQLSRKANSLPIFQGIYIADLKEKSTLKAAGMKINDIIIQINDESMYDVDELGLKIEAMPKTTTMSITFLRLQASGDFSTQTVTAANIIDGATFYKI